MDISVELLRDIYLNRVEKRDLRTEAVSSIKSFDFVDQPISYEEFFKNFLLPNRPCLLGSWCTEEWNSRNDWVTQDNKPNLSFLEENYGSTVCPIANCNLEQYSSHPKEDITLSEYVEYIKDYRRNDYPKEAKCLYLKDWHFVKAFPDYHAYSTPIFFQSDWMNEFWDSRSDTEDDYRFVYFGPKGSWTPFHADVFRSFSWSANICGKKKWIFFPPGEELHLKDNFHNLVFDLRSTDIQDPKLFPNADKVKKRFEVIQNAGEVIFVPSGWHHQVFNLEDTISINHNWLNGCNVDISWNFIKERLKGVQREIADCKDMDGWNQQCQLILKADSGIDYCDFYKMMCRIGSSRIQKLEQYDLQQTLHRCSHDIFDLIEIKYIIKDMLQTPEFKELIKSSTLELHPEEYIEKIAGIIDTCLSDDAKV